MTMLIVALQGLTDGQWLTLVTVIVSIGGASLVSLLAYLSNQRTRAQNGAAALTQRRDDWGSVIEQLRHDIDDLREENRELRRENIRLNGALDDLRTKYFELVARTGGERATRELSINQQFDSGQGPRQSGGTQWNAGSVRAERDLYQGSTHNEQKGPTNDTTTDQPAK
jgi:hypothetical protein